jgi:ABC-2 type transport system ATP-binding protein
VSTSDHEPEESGGAPFSVRELGKQYESRGAGPGRVPDTGAVLSARGVRHEYGDLVALERLDLAVPAGQLVALVGPNGAGKSTLMSIAAGLLEATAGTITVSGAAAGTLPARAATSYVPDTPVLYDDISLNEHLEYIARLHGVKDWSGRAAELLERLGMDQWGDSMPSQFSKGMRQKASLALGFVRPFSLLLADEPFDGLDPASRRALVALLEEICAAGAAVVVSTHRTEVTDLAHRAIALHDGKITYDGAPERSVIEDLLPDGGG